MALLAGGKAGLVSFEDAIGKALLQLVKFRQASQTWSLVWLEVAIGDPVRMWDGGAAVTGGGMGGTTHHRVGLLEAKKHWTRPETV